VVKVEIPEGISKQRDEEVREIAWKTKKRLCQELGSRWA